MFYFGQGQVFIKKGKPITINRVSLRYSIPSETKHWSQMGKQLISLYFLQNFTSRDHRIPLELPFIVFSANEPVSIKKEGREYAERGKNQTAVSALLF